MIIFGWLLCHGTAFAATLVTGIDVDSIPGALKIELSGRTQFKVLKLDAREIMVAFKSTDLPETVATEHSGLHMVSHVTMKQLPNQVVTFMIDTAEDVNTVHADWQDDSDTLLVRFDTADNKPGNTIPVKRRKFKKNIIPATETEPNGNGSGKAEEPPSETVAAAAPSSPVAEEPLSETVATAAPSSSVAEEPLSETVAAPAPSLPVEADDPPLEKKSTPEVVSTPVPALNAPTTTTKKEADLNGLLDEMLQNGCSQSQTLEKALAHCKRNEWKQVFDLLSTVLNPAGSDACEAELYYLRAYASYKMNRSGDEELYLDAVNFFEDAISYFESSSYAPYAMLALASIYDELNNFIEAKGYYKVVLKTYPNHPVYAEALFNLGKLHAKQQEQRQAIAVFRQFIEEYPESPRLTSVRDALGKALYEAGEFTESLALLTAVLEEDPDRVYKDPDLLVYVGNLNYQLDQPEDAREAMLKAVNLYPETEAVPDLLTIIADTFRDEGRTDQAKKMYQLVMETHPGTDGFVVSAVRFAELLSTRKEKEAQYRMIVDDFPDHAMAKLAVVRLADLHAQAGEYNTAIDILREIGISNLKGLKNQADYVMASSFEGLFKKLTGQNDPIAVITAYEKDKSLINRLENASIYDMTGTAFLNAYLYRQAAELLQKSYKLSSPNNRPPDLYYRLGVAFQEIGKDMQAREMLDVYFEKDPNSPKHSDAYLRIGRLLAAENEWDRALAALKAGYRQSAPDAEKADILLSQAEVNQALGKDAAVPDLLIKAINLLASSPEVSQDRLVQAHRFLGESYMKLSSYEKAVDAFTMALKFSETDRPPSLLFLLAESNMKARKSEAARAVFSEIIDSGDVFWSRMAQERLRAMELEAKLEL